MVALEVDAAGSIFPGPEKEVALSQPPNSWSGLISQAHQAFHPGVDTGLGVLRGPIHQPLGWGGGGLSGIQLSSLPWGRGGMSDGAEPAPLQGLL